MEFNTFKTLEELCSVISDCPHATPKWTDSGVIVIRSNNIKNGKIDLSSPSYTTKEEYLSRIKRAIPKPGDLIITREAPMGQVGMIPENTECCLGQRMVLLKANPTLCNNYYLLYTLQSTFVQNQIRGNEGTGTTVSNLRIPFLKKLKIPYISLEKQKYFVNLLRPFDEGIENNNKIIENLENLAQKIFLTIVKNAKNQDSTLESYALINPKRILKKGTYARYIDMSALSTTCATPEHCNFKNYAGGIKFSNGDSLLARITPCLENGKAAFINFLNKNEVAFGSTEFISLHSKGELPNEFFYCLIRTKSFREFSIKRLTGTSGRQRISAKDIEKYPLPTFNAKQIDYLNKHLPIIFKYVSTCATQNKTLAKLRDLLLHKLFSGDLKPLGKQ